MRADRLLAILGLLQTHGKLPSKTLAEQLEVSERTIHRDMEALGAAGIPVYAERGHLGGWALPEGYRSRLTGMTAEEINALLFLQSSGLVRDLGLQESAKSALGKLRAALSPAARQDADFARQRIYVDGAGWRDAAGGDPKPGASEEAGKSVLATVQEAVWAERKLLIAYDGGSDTANGRAETARPRTILPLGLVAKQQVWYAMALTEPDGELRTFRVSRIAQARVTDEPFVRPEGFDLAASWAASVRSFKTNLPRYDAVVRIDASRWESFRRERFVVVREHRSFGTDAVEAEVAFNTLESACGILLGYGRLAEAVSPAGLRAAVAEEARAIGERYAADKNAD